MKLNYDIIIIGGGLAGLTTALQLSKSSFSVLLIEKNTFPHHKVCGEYVSNEVLPYLNRLGVDPLALGARQIITCKFSMFPALKFRSNCIREFGISGYKFDFLMFQQLRNKVPAVQPFLNENIIGFKM